MMTDWPAISPKADISKIEDTILLDRNVSGCKTMMSKL